ncbi:hypothetical protein TNCT_728941 [Trichonephila clavata]|uniref:Uncharacterized protein n=1 Tax=Trichonephila clavata TaxID=2740835 RepID=A0A8X6J601_TRICU|nr:hypothetical protein TNCT_728941 [Trichonephila clavata]
MPHEIITHFQNRHSAVLSQFINNAPFSQRFHPIPIYLRGVGAEKNDSENRTREPSPFNTSDEIMEEKLISSLCSSETKDCRDLKPQWMTEAFISFASVASRRKA